MAKSFRCNIYKTGGYILQAKSLYLFTSLLHYLLTFLISPAARQVLGWPHSCPCWLSCTIRARLDNNVQGPQNTSEEFSREPCSGLFGGASSNAACRMLSTFVWMCPELLDSVKGAPVSPGPAVRALASLVV